MSASFRQALNIRYPRDRKAAHDRPLTIADGQGPATFGRSTSEPKSLTIPVGLFTHSTNGKSCSYFVVSYGQSTERDGPRGMLSR